MNFRDDALKKAFKRLPESLLSFVARKGVEPLTSGL